MKKIILLLAVLLFVSSAQAFTSGPYIAARAAFNSTEYKTKTSDRDTVFASSFAVGARAKLFRLEFEFTNTLRAKIDDLRYRQFRYMMQSYFDLPIRSVIRPFLNVGAGMAQTEVNSKKKVPGHDKDDDDGSFVWNIGGGFGLDITKALSLDLGYRYVMPSNAKFYSGKMTLKMKGHEGYLGIRYTF